MIQLMKRTKYKQISKSKQFLHRLSLQLKGDFFINIPEELLYGKLLHSEPHFLLHTHFIKSVHFLGSPKASPTILDSIVLEFLLFDFQHIAQFRVIGVEIVTEFFLQSFHSVQHWTLLSVFWRSYVVIFVFLLQIVSLFGPALVSNFDHFDFNQRIIISHSVYPHL